MKKITTVAEATQKTVRVSNALTIAEAIVADIQKAVEKNDKVPALEFEPSDFNQQELSWSVAKKVRSIIGADKLQVLTVAEKKATYTARKVSGLKYRNLKVIEEMAAQAAA